MDEDLAALLSRATRRMVDAERPVLEAHGLAMWEYVVLTQLARGDAPAQQVLAAGIRYDKTRLIGLLDGLERRDLVTRSPDPADRRARVVRITPAGRELHAAAQAAIRAMEDDALGGLTAAQRRALRELLPRLAGP